MLNYRTLLKLSLVAALALPGVAAAHADTLQQVTTSSSQAANDSISWSQKGADATVLGTSFSATTTNGNSVTVNMGAANSIISVVCSATPCSWTGGGFTAGDSLLWTSDAGNGGSGPVTLNFSQNVSGAGAMIQADLPGQFTGQIQVYNGSTLLATYTVQSDTAGDPVYLGAIDNTGANISSVVFSLTSCASLCTDFGLDTVELNSATAAPALTSPVPGSTTPLGGPTTFTWSAGTGSTMFDLYIGTSVGAKDIYASGWVANTVTSEMVTIPANGVKLYVRLWYKMSSTYNYNDYTFTEDAAPALTSPSSSPVGGSTTFTWSAGTGSTMFELYVGTSAGAKDIYASGQVASTVTSKTVTIPANGAKLYVRLWYELPGAWYYKDYTFTEDAAPALTSPSSSPVGGSTTFTWSAGTGSTMFDLYVGTSAGAKDIYASGQVASTVTSKTVTIPANGAKLYVRLWYELAGAWSYKDYTFTEDAAPTLTSPSSSPVGGSTTFTWSAGTGSTMFELYVGTSVGAKDIYASGQVASTVTSKTVTIPVNGATIHVRLWYEIPGAWYYKDYTFTEATAPALTKPTLSPVSGSTQFAWSAGNGSSMFYLYIGTSVGARDIYSSGQVANTVTSETVNITPTGNKIYVRLWYKIGGTWYYKDYSFTT